MILVVCRCWFVVALSSINFPQAHDVRLVATAAMPPYRHRFIYKNNNIKREKKNFKNWRQAWKRKIIFIYMVRKRDNTPQSGNKNQHWEWKRNEICIKNVTDLTKTMYNNNNNNNKYYCVESSKLIIIIVVEENNTSHIISNWLGFCTVIIVVAVVCYSCCRFHFVSLL